MHHPIDLTQLEAARRRFQQAYTEFVATGLLDELRTTEVLSILPILLA